MYEGFRQPSDKILSMLHLNVRSVAKNLAHLNNYLKLLNHEFPIIGLTET